MLSSSIFLSFCVGRFLLFLFCRTFLSFYTAYTMKLAVAIDLQKLPKTIITVRHELDIVLEIRRGSDVLVFEISRALRC